MSDFWHWLFSAKGDVAIAGAAGGMVRWATLSEDWRSGIVSLIVGIACATYLAEVSTGTIEAILRTFTIKASVPETTAAFIVGIGGITISGFVLDLIKSYRRDKAKGG